MKRHRTETQLKLFSPVDWTGVQRDLLRGIETRGKARQAAELHADRPQAQPLPMNSPVCPNTRKIKPPFRVANKAVEMVYKNANLKTMRRRAGMQ